MGRTLKRRDFLHILGLLLLGCAHRQTSQTSAAKHNLLIQPYFDTEKKTYGILSINLDTGECFSKETTFDVHQISYDSCENLFIGANKYGNRYLTFRNARIDDVKYYEIDARKFSLSGHVLCGPVENNYYYFSGIESSSGRNAIVKIKKTDHSVSALAIFEKTFPPVHDMKFLPGTSTIVATAGKKLHYFDLDKTEHHEEVNVSTAYEESSIRHFEVFGSNLAVQSNIISKDYKYKSAEIISISRANKMSKIVGRYFEDLQDSEIHDLAISSDLSFVAAAHAGASSLTFINLLSGEFSRVNFPERVYRVCPWPGSSDFLVVAKANLYRMTAAQMNFIKIELKSSVLSEKYYYNHRTLIEV